MRPLKKPLTRLLPRLLPRLKLLLALWLLLIPTTGSALAEGELRLDGSLQQGGLVVGTVVPGAKVSLNDKAVEVYDDGRFLIGFSRDAAPEQKLVVRWPWGWIDTYAYAIVQRTYAVQNITGVNQDTVTPPKAVQDRIALEAQQIRAARNAQTQVPFFDAGWIWPVAGRVTGVYGSARSYNGTPGAPHWGIDIAAPANTAVVAPSAGIVRLVHRDNFIAGGLIILDHGYGLTSSFLHLARTDVAPGDVVARGTQIGLVGSTGRSTGPHLDWRINLGSDLRLDVALLPLPEGP